MNHLVALKEGGKIKNIGLTNFDTEHMALLIDRGAPVVSNQVALFRVYKRTCSSFFVIIPSCDNSCLCFTPHSPYSVFSDRILRD